MHSSFIFFAKKSLPVNLLSRKAGYLMKSLAFNETHYTFINFSTMRSSTPSRAPNLDKAVGIQLKLVSNMDLIAAARVYGRSGDDSPMIHRRRTKKKEGRIPPPLPISKKKSFLCGLASMAIAAIRMYRADPTFPFDFQCKIGLLSPLSISLSLSLSLRLIEPQLDRILGRCEVAR